MSRVRFLASFAAGAALAVAALAPLPAQPWREGRDRTGGACTYYADANYQGMRATLEDGGEIASIGPVWNDRLSSVQCDPGCALDTFEHVNFEGARERFRGDVAFVGPAWNDRASALRVQCGRRDRATGGCSYYGDANYQGMRARLEDGGEIASIGPLWNDRLSSVQCDPGCALETFEHVNFGGARERFRGDVAFVGPAWNDRASALRVQCGGRDRDRKD